MTEAVKLTAGQKVVVKAGVGYLNEGAKGTVDGEQAGIWVRILWDEPKGERVNGDYLAASFDVAEVAKVDYAEAIALLIDKTTEEAYAKGKADGTADATVISNVDKAQLQDLFTRLSNDSNSILRILQKHKVL